MKKTFRVLVVVLLMVQALVGSYGWGRFVVEKATNSQLSSTLKDVQSTCRQYEDEIGELYKLLEGNE